METTSPKAPSYRHIFRDGFIPRLYRSFRSTLDGQRAWQEVINRLDEKSRQDYFRFNITFPGQEPAIDDIDSMNGLRVCVNLQPQILQDNQATIFALLASTFFFELIEMPSYDSRIFYCQGVIRCRLQGQKIMQALGRLRSAGLGFYKEAELLGQVNFDRDICNLCHRYSKQVDFYIRHPTDTVTLYVQNDFYPRRKISGFPQSMESIAKQQNLGLVFGAANHGASNKISCRNCMAEHPMRLKRKLSHADILHQPSKRFRRLD